MVSAKPSRKLREQLTKALRSERLGEALGHYEALQAMEPDEPRWPHRKGDLLKRLGRPLAAVEAYERAVDLYAEKGFVARAAAMAKVVLGLAPGRVDVLARVSPEAARKLHRSTRPSGVTADAPTGEPKRIADAAPPLIANEAAAGEIRNFSIPPAGQSRRIELDISDAEVQDPPPPSDDGSDDRPTAERLAKLSSTPLFAEVPQSVLARMVNESNLVDLEPGDRLFDKGTSADALFTLVEGTVQMIRRSDEDAIMLSEGEVLGISALLEHVRYEGDAIALTKVRALRISTASLDRLVAEYPRLRDILLEVLGRRLVSTLVRASPMFSSFDDAARAELAGMFEVRSAVSGTAILEAAKDVDGLYIPMIGELTVIGPSGERIGSLKLGQALGEHAMLTRTPSPITVKAASEVLLLRMSAGRFHELASKHPKMVAHLRELSKRPSPTTLSLLPDGPADPSTGA